MTLIALTHVPSPCLADGERTHVGRVPIDYGLALRQHAAYRDMLRRRGAEVIALDSYSDQPDCVFVEDTAVVLDEIAVLALMGAASRRDETAGIEPVLRKYRELHRIEPPATLEGGDVLLVGKTLLVGLSSRTNLQGVRALESIGRHHGYKVVPIQLKDCLHLKSACTALPDRSLLVNPAWLDIEALQDFEMLLIPSREPWAADILTIGRTVCVLAPHIETAELIRKRGFAVETVDLSEFAKAEGGITCLSILFNSRNLA
jgi:dimethylargininase